MSYGIGGCCPQCGGEPMTAGFAHRAECPTLLTTAVGSGDRSLLRAPTEKAKLAAWDAYCEDQTLDLNQDIARAVDRAVEAAYAVGGLRGTEDRALREALEKDAHDADTGYKIAAGTDVRSLFAAIRERARRVLRESVEGGQRT